MRRCTLFARQYSFNAAAASASRSEPRAPIFSRAAAPSAASSPRAASPGAPSPSGEPLLVAEKAPLETDFAKLWPESPSFVAKFAQLGFSVPTPIQSQAWPVACSGADLVGIAGTGTGKTLAFLLPILAALQRSPPERARAMPSALILVPTRELCLQIADVARQWLPLAFPRSGARALATAFGGQSPRAQLADLFAAHVVVATPGRLNDFLQSGQVDLSRVAHVVIDEGDRMLDMGFEPQVRAIFSCLPREKQVMFFSATWAKEVSFLARSFQREGAVLVDAGGAGAVASGVSQSFAGVGDEAERREKLLDVLGSDAKVQKVLIFANTKERVEQLSNFFAEREISHAALFGGLTQAMRERNLEAFRAGVVPVLMGTDVMARGLDIPDVDLVVNYDVPNDPDVYVHRVGRAGRAGKVGKCVTFLSEWAPRDHQWGMDVIRRMEKEMPKDTLESLKKIVNPGLLRRGRATGSTQRMGGKNSIHVFGENRQKLYAVNGGSRSNSGSGAFYGNGHNSGYGGNRSGSGSGAYFGNNRGSSGAFSRPRFDEKRGEGKFGARKFERQ